MSKAADSSIRGASSSKSTSTSSTTSSGCPPPTARTPSLQTATSSTSDPLGIPTALSNSANTAIGMSLSETSGDASALSDTSAGGSLSTVTSKSVTSQHDMRDKKPSKAVVPPPKKSMPLPQQQQHQQKKNQKTFTSRPSNYHFPGVGRTTRSDQVVYDVADLSSARRGLQAPPTLAPAPSPAPPTQVQPVRGNGRKYCLGYGPEPPKFANKIVLLAETPDGKHRVQMTIDMQIIAGEALGAAGSKVTLVPKKVIVGGQEMSLDTQTETVNSEMSQQQHQQL